MKQSIRAILARLGYRLEGIRHTPRQLLEPGCLRRLELDDVICRRIVAQGPAFSFIQIGAYDGKSTDPLRKYIKRYGWRGVMLEPQPGPAHQLRSLYEGVPEILVLEAAVDVQRGARPLYTVELPNQVPRWVGGMASFDRAHILKHNYLIPGIADMVREVVVDCITFDDVLDRLPGAPDLLQIDAEGADGYLLSLFPFERIKPAIVHWESKNLSRAQKELALDLLCSHGYRIAPSGEEDMLAALPEETW